MSKKKKSTPSGTVIEAMTMARWHLLRALEYTSKDHVAEVTKIGASTLANIQYGLCEFVQNGSTRRIKDFADKLAAANENVNPWRQALESDDIRLEIESMRATSPKVRKIRKEMARKASEQKAGK